MAKSINPKSGELIKTYDDYTGPFVDKIIEEVSIAQKSWMQLSVRKRSQMMKQLGETLLQHKDKLAKVCHEEMGKLLNEAQSEVEKCAWAAAYYAEHAEDFLKDIKIPTDAKESYVTFKPLGVVLAIMPWNFPFWQVIRFSAPALCAGNTCLLKHASNVTGCSLMLEEIFKEAGFPANVFRSLVIPSREVDRVIENRLVSAVTLTGSNQAGKAVAKKAGEELKKVVLELGGSDAYLILKDANLKYAASTLIKGRLLNSGQSCISPKRLIVDKAVYEEFIQLLEDEIKRVPEIAPLARVDLREDVHTQVEKTITSGARCLVGGKISDSESAWYPPTLLVDVQPGMSAFEEEVFGPVICVIPADNEEEAIALANRSIYGLGGGIFSDDLQRAIQIAEEKIESGGVFINDFLKSDPRLPFGGIKESGYGRELSFLGIKEFVNAKTISVHKSKEL